MFWPAVGAMAAEWLGSEVQGQYNAKEASKQRSWSEMMSNTAYTRAAHDLRTAGLNRVLALGSPAASPSGSSASVEKPNFSGAAIQASTAKQQIAQSKAEEKLLNQKDKESQSSESLNRATELTQVTQQGLNVANAAAANEHAKLLAEQARKTRIEADRGDVMNPFYEIAGEVTRKLSRWLRHSAKGENTVVKEVKDFFDAAVNEVQTGDGVKRVWKDFTSKPKPNSNVQFQDQKWPKFRRGGK